VTGAAPGAEGREALAARDEDDVLAARALELEDAVEDAGEELAAIAAQVAGRRRAELDVSQGRVHENDSVVRVIRMRAINA
jgi:hypothetical protein